VYVETTIVSYLAARMSRNLIVAAHQQLTEEWWLTRRTGFDLYTSLLVHQEAAAGDEVYARKRRDLLKDIPLLTSNEGVLTLGSELLHRRIIPEKAAEDASHIAIAAVHGMDYLLTWNCRHIANAQMQRQVSATCREIGYEPPVICTPEELMGV
jgi:hypothetical protein